MDESEIYRALSEIFSDVFLRDDIVVTSALSAKNVAEWDSFKQIEIVMATEERFGVKFTTREVDGMESVGDLASLVNDKLRNR